MGLRQHALRIAAAWSLALCLCACAQPLANGPTTPDSAVTQSPDSKPTYALINRLSWGANTSTVAQWREQAWASLVQAQLHPSAHKLPPEQQAQMDAMTISTTPMPELVWQLEQQRKDADGMASEVDVKAARQAYQQELSRLQREAATRHVLRALYSPAQVQEQMTWFWLNHFSVFQGKGNLRAMVGDYEEHAIRPHALGNFRQLLGAVVLHPAMLRYLDNNQNAVGRLNENFARELMELHTLGVDAGYSQRDVQELARVLTGVGVNLVRPDALQKKTQKPGYVQRGLFEFNPARHDQGDKLLLGKSIQGGRGLNELSNALDQLALHPATAAFISRKLALFWLSDAPPPALVSSMAQTYLSSRGDIARTLETLLMSPEFLAAEAPRFKDPMRYVISAVRLAYDQKPVLNVGPVLNWLNRMGEPLYGRSTPDGYPLLSSAWSSPGQMTTRFEIAKAIGSGNAGLFRGDGPQAQERAAFPQLSNALYFEAIAKTLAPATRRALDLAVSPQEWNIFLLSSPEMMSR